MASSPPSPAASKVAVRALTDDELHELQARLDDVPAPLDPLDTSMLDGYLCGVLLQPQRIAAAQWLPYVTDVDGRALPAGFDSTALHALVQRRHAELDDAIGRRQWFDPWIFELDEEASPSETVYPWVAGFSTALELFPALMQMNSQALLEPMATIYAHLDPDDLEDADDLLAEIETLEPAADLDEAAEGLVRSVLHMADVSRPVALKPSPSRPRARPRPPGPSGQGRPRR